jgi:hypothetical protein
MQLSFITAIDCLAISSFLYLLIAFRDYRRRRGLPYPPGPPSRPIIGNLFDVPKKSPWIKYADLSNKYGKAHIIVIPSANIDIIRRCLLSSSFWSGRCGAELTICHQRSARKARRGICRSAYFAYRGNVCLTVFISNYPAT